MKSYNLFQWLICGRMPLTWRASLGSNLRTPTPPRPQAPHRDPNVFPLYPTCGRDPWVDNRWAIAFRTEGSLYSVSLQLHIFFGNWICSKLYDSMTSNGFFHLLIATPKSSQILESYKRGICSICRLWPLANSSTRNFLWNSSYWQYFSDKILETVKAK